MLTVIAIPAGLLIGLSLGALGGGGSILTVPALVYLLHQQPHAATAGSLVIVGITALAGMIAHWRAGRVRVAQGVTFGILGVAGSYAGSALSASIRPDLLLVLFAMLMLVGAAAMMRRRSSSGGPQAAAASGDPRAAAVPGRGAVFLPGGRTQTMTVWSPVTAAADPEPAGRGHRGAPAALRPVKVVAAATGVGLLTGFFGVGGGFVIVPALVLALGFEMPAAVGTSLLVIAIDSVAALGARLSGGIHLDWPLTGVFVLAALAGALGGNRVASRVSAARLSAAFTVLLIAVAGYTLARSLPALA